MALKNQATLLYPILCQKTAPVLLSPQKNNHPKQKHTLFLPNATKKPRNPPRLLPLSNFRRSGGVRAPLQLSGKQFEAVALGAAEGLHEVLAEEQERY